MWIGRDEREKEKGQETEMEGKGQKPLVTVGGLQFKN
jgi:hypothetical protein